MSEKQSRGPGINTGGQVPALPSRIPRLASIDPLYAQVAIPSQKARYAKLASAFAEQFPEYAGRPAPLFFSSPGRTELCGNHTDHNHGKVLAASIDLDTIAAAAPRRDGLVRIVSEGFGAFEVDLAELSALPRERGSSAAIVRGMAAALAAGRGRDSPVRGFDALVRSDVLPGSGLSSSAAFEVLVGAMFSIFSGLDASPAEIAEAGRHAENVYFGKPCGLMDQLACALGNTAAMDFADPAEAKVELLRFDPDDYGLSLVIVATGGSHADLTEDYAAIPAEMKAVATILGRPTLAGTSRKELLDRVGEIHGRCGDRAFLRAWHFVGETERSSLLGKAILEGDIGACLAVIKASGDSSARFLQNLYPARSPLEQGLPLALALTEDFLAGSGACRVHGGGFAGTIQAYVPLSRLEAYRVLMRSVFGEASVFPLRIRPYGVVCIENPQGASHER